MSVELPSGPFGCILADPPWAYRNHSGPADGEHRGAHDHYPTTTTEELCQLPVARCADENSALFMWVVDSHLEEALTLGKAWGFEFKTCAFVWVKSKPGGWPHVGMGYWTRKQTEQCWLFTRGSPERLDKGVQQIIHCPRGAHSAKPEQQYGLIERLVPGPYLEMFSRTSKPGWTAWGNQIGARDDTLFGVSP